MKKLTLRLKALASDPRLDIVLFLADGEKTQGEIAHHLGMSCSGAYFHLAKLLREGYIQKRRQGGTTFYTLVLSFRASRLFRQIQKQAKVGIEVFMKT